MDSRGCTSGHLIDRISHRVRVNKPKTVARIAGVVAILILLAKSVGFIREVVLAEEFGTGWQRDAYNLALQLPSFALILLGGLNGPIHSATLSALTRLRESAREVNGSPVLTLLLGIGSVMGVVAALSFAFADQLVAVQGPWVSKATHDLAVMQFRIMIPVLLVGPCVGVFCGLSTDRGHFALPSLSPAISSLSIIAFVLWRPGDPLALAGGTAVGAVLQLALQGLPTLFESKAKGLILSPMSRRDPIMRETRELLWPAILSSTIGQINVFVGTFFLSRAPVGSIAAWGYANIVYQLPLGTLLAAMLVPLFPRLTSAAARGDRQELFLNLNKGVGLIALVACPMAIFTATLALPIVRFAYERGKFEETGGTGPTSMVLAILCIGMVGYALRDLFVRVFYAVGDSKTPMRIMILSIALNIGLNAFFLFGLKAGLAGIAWSTVLVTWLNFGQIAWALRGKLGTLGLRPSLPEVGRALGASIAAAGALWWLRDALQFPRGFWGTLAELSVLGITGILCYGAVYWLLRACRPGAPATHGRPPAN